MKVSKPKNTLSNTMSQLMFGVERGSLVSDQLAQELGYKDWVDCSNKDWDQGRKILKETHKQVKKEWDALTLGVA